jgi:hypothetical protein
MTAVVKGITPVDYRRHALHDLQRDWPETNCYVDLWIEVLGALGHDPVAGLGFTVRQDFEGDQFTFFKFPTADLDALYGAEVLELAIFDDVIGHIEVQAARGRLAMLELDGFYLPDTKGLSYRTEHTKTTVGVNVIDRAARRLEYFHNAGYYALDGEDFDGLFRQLPAHRDVADMPFPYTEFVKFDARRPSGSLVAPAIALMQRHVARRPAENPIHAYKTNFATHTERLLAGPPAFFHKYTFNVLRQLGANHELLSSHLEWLRMGGVGGLDRAIAKTREISGAAKAVQFQLARAVARRNFASFEAPLERMADAYDQAFADLVRVFGDEQCRIAS